MPISACDFNDGVFPSSVRMSHVSSSNTSEERLPSKQTFRPSVVCSSYGSGGEAQVVIGDFEKALDKYAPIVTGIRQIYADSDRHCTNIRP